MDSTVILFILFCDGEVWYGISKEDEHLLKMSVIWLAISFLVTTIVIRRSH